MDVQFGQAPAEDTRPVVEGVLVAIAAVEVEQLQVAQRLGVAIVVDQGDGVPGQPALPNIGTQLAGVEGKGQVKPQGEAGLGE